MGEKGLSWERAAPQTATSQPCSAVQAQARAQRCSCWRPPCSGAAARGALAVQRSARLIPEHAEKGDIPARPAIGPPPRVFSTLSACSSLVWRGSRCAASDGGGDTLRQVTRTAEPRRTLPMHREGDSESGREYVCVYIDHRRDAAVHMLYMRREMYTRVV